MNQRLDENESVLRIWDFAWSQDRDHSDRMVALAASSLLELALQNILSSCFVEMDADALARLFKTDTGVLGTFASRIEMAFAVGAIGPDTRHDLTTVRHIRNAFAHVRAYLTFESPEIASLCDDLKWPTLVMSGDFFGKPIETRRDKFVETCRMRWLISIEFPGDLKRPNPYPDGDAGR